ncbi:MAG: hypothetical protein QXL10_05565 [Candidatus Bathyarchaeia archaeon]
MAQITIEYMIMVPLLIMQIFLLPMTVGWIMTMWTESRQTLALREVAGYIGSSVHQLYSALSHESIAISNGTQGNSTVCIDMAVPVFIEGYVYEANATLRETSEASAESSKILDITVKFVDSDVQATASVTLGSDVKWESSKFVSNSPTARLVATKSAENNTILMRFMG